MISTEELQITAPPRKEGSNVWASAERARQTTERTEKFNRMPQTDLCCENEFAQATGGENDVSGIKNSKDYSTGFTSL